MITVHTGIPIPNARGDGSEVSAAMSTLEIGNCMDIPSADKGPNYRNNLYAMAKRHGIRIVMRKYSDFYRVWRTA